MNDKRLLAVCCLLAVYASSAWHLLLSFSAAAEQTSRAFVIKNVRIFDGSAVIPSGTVIVEGDKIKSVGDLAANVDGAEVVDGTGHTLLPGLIDSHAHANERFSLRQALVFGVTTELDMFTDYRMAARMRTEQAEGKATDRADLFSAGTVVTAPFGHGTEYGLKIPTIGGPAEAEAFVDARIDEGSDYIKIIYDYGLKIPTISKETMTATIAAAHSRGKLAVVHISTREGARHGIEAGADGLVHLFIDRSPEAEFGRFVADHSAFIVPTLTVLESAAGLPGAASLLSDPDLSPAMSAMDAANLRKLIRWRFPVTYGAAEETVRQLQAARVPILAGSDAPNPGTVHGASLHRELELLVQAGLTPIQALIAATSAPAAAFRLFDRGAIRPGLRADLLLVKGDPTTEIKATRAIVRIWKLGAAVDRKAYLDMLERMKIRNERFREQPQPPLPVIPQ